MLEELGRILAAAGLAHAHRDEPGTAGLGTRQIKATTTVCDFDDGITVPLPSYGSQPRLGKTE